MSSFNNMGPLASYITSCRASASGRRFAFGRNFSTKQLPARPMRSYSSPLTFKPAKYASGAAFTDNEAYATVDQNPTYRILLDYSSDEASGTPSSPLRLLRKAMHQALYVGNRQRTRSLSAIEYIFKLYTALLGQGSLEPFDTHAIARLLTLTSDSKPLAIRNAISRYIDVFAGHYVTKALPPHSQASKDLLLLYRNMGNHERATWLWDWMVHQDDRYVSTKTYAEAIRLAAASNKSLRVCEKLYEEALIRYSDELVSLILSPGFMLPSQTNNWKDVVFEQHLCLAIFYARIRRGDWRTAYLNLDTAFRLWPSAIHCQFLKDLLKGRPVHEGYQVYSLFCQAGAYVGGQELQILLDSMARACEDTVDLLLKSELTKAMLEAVTVFVTIEHSRLDTRHLN